MKVNLLKHVMVDGVFFRAGAHEVDSLPEKIRNDLSLVEYANAADQPDALQSSSPPAAAGRKIAPAATKKSMTR